MHKDSIWQAVRDEVAHHAAAEPMLAPYLQASVLQHATLEQSVAAILADRLAGGALDAAAIAELAVKGFEADPVAGRAIRADLACRKVRDPACRGYATALLYMKGFHALQAYRVGHWLWSEGREALASYLQSRVATVLSVDIHPAAKILGNIVIGEGAKIGAGSVVVTDVPPHTTAAGVPAKIVGEPGSDHPALVMDQSLENRQSNPDA